MKVLSLMVCVFACSLVFGPALENFPLSLVENRAVAWIPSQTPSPWTFGDGPTPFSESTVSNTELSEFFCPHRVPGRELSEFLSAYYL